MNKYLSLTHPQKRVWYIEKIYPNTSINNIGGCVKIRGAINFKILEKSINSLIEKNDGLRLKIVEYDNEPQQYVDRYENIHLQYLDFSVYDTPEKEFNKWMDEEFCKPFFKENEWLFSFTLFKISNDNNGYIAKFHHIICDGWSINLMTEQICDYYTNLIDGAEITNEQKDSYIEYIENEKKYVLSDKFSENKAFWIEKFTNVMHVIQRTNKDETKGKRKTFNLGIDVSKRIKEFSIHHKFSLNTFFISLYIIYQYKTNYQKEIIIGTPVINRLGKKERNMFGMFTSTMPFRYVINDDINIIDNITLINSELMSCYRKQRYPYDLLIKDLELHKKGYDSLFTSSVNYYNTRPNLEINEYPIENIEFYNGHQFHSLQMIIKDWNDSGSLLIELDYKVNDYSDEDIEQAFKNLLNLINYIIINPYEKTKRVSLLSDEEKNYLLYEFNKTRVEYPQERTIFELFEDQVERTPEKIAIECNGNEITYYELNMKANQLARYLIQIGIKQESIVGILTSRSIETIVGILGIIKAGGTYLPIDTNIPVDRACYMLENSNANIMLTNIDHITDFKFKGTIINLNDANIYKGDHKNLNRKISNRSLVYIIYTSGSTGNPKGTMIEHKGLVNYIWWAKKMYVDDKDDIFALYSSLAFDLTVTSVFTPLISGCKIIIYNDYYDGEYSLYKIIRDNKATIIKATPSHLMLLKDFDNENTSIKKFIVGGEDLKVELAKKIHEIFKGNIEIFNEYGPTETVVGCMIYKYRYDYDTRISVPIGYPIDNVQIYVLDDNYEPIPHNTLGDIYISGDGVARGYFNKPELTSEKFLENPYINGSRMYKTGDLARFLYDGTIEYTGRKDQQVKIHGYRVELNEIEAHINSHKAIKDSIVIDTEDTNKSKCLCAYYIKLADVTHEEIKNHLSIYLPHYMIPLHFIEIDRIPFTAGGKIDKKQLPQPKNEVIENTEDTQCKSLKEKKLLAVVSDVLNIQNANIKNNFYRIGGDSIKAIQIVSKLKDIGCKLTVQDILSHPVFHELLSYIEENNENEMNQSICQGHIENTPIISWFFAQNFYDVNYFCQSVLLEINDDISKDKLTVIMSKLIEQHDSLRMNYDCKTGTLFYNNRYLKEKYVIEEYNLAELNDAEQEEQIVFITEKIKSEFNIEKDILIKTCYFHLGQGKNRVLISAHHLIVDGISWRIIISEIDTMLQQTKQTNELILSHKTSSYQKWANELIDYTNQHLPEEDYWINTLEKTFYFPSDHELGENTVGSCFIISEQLDAKRTDALVTKANISHNTEVKDLLIISLLRTIKETTGKEDIVIELEGHGREDIFEKINVTNTVGWFTSIFPFYICLKGEDLSEQIKEVKRAIRAIPNKGIGYGLLREISKKIMDKAHQYIRFNYLGDFTAKYDNCTIIEQRLKNESHIKNNLTCLIEINCYILKNKLIFTLTYSKNKFSDSTMKRFLKELKSNLITIINYCCEKKVIELSPIDYDMVDLTQEELNKLFH